MLPKARRESAEEIAAPQRTLICGVMEFAQARGIEHYTTLTDTAFLKRIEAVWPYRTLGKARHFTDGGGEAIAIMIDAGPHVLAMSRDRTGILAPVLFELTPKGPQGSPQDRATLKETAMKAHDRLPRSDTEHIVQAAEDMSRQLGARSSQAEPEDMIALVDAFTNTVRGYLQDTPPGEKV